MERKDGKGSWWQTLPGIITGMGALITAIAGLVLALHQIDPGKKPQQQATSPTEAVVGVPGPSLADALTRYTFEFGWSASPIGSVDDRVYAYPVSEIQLTGDNFVTFKYARPGGGEIRATLSGQKLAGTWRDVDGEGELEVLFDDGYSRGTGWWNRGGQTQKYNAFMRRTN